jgi:diadenosine tetraphosphate (Ap4A) HIT family hydrolase
LNTDVAVAKQDACRFCVAKPSRRLIVDGKLGFAAWDRHPVSDGHFLVIPYRHFADYFEIRDDEREELWSLVASGRDIVEERYQPDGYNIGINVGVWAGQSIHHLHIHVIPRYQGDVENPKGGVRGVLPAKRHYTIQAD